MAIPGGKSADRGLFFLKVKLDCYQSHMLYYLTVLLHTLVDLSSRCCIYSCCLKMRQAEENETIGGKKHVSNFNEAIA